MNKEKIVIITAPSGSGKTTLVKRLLAACPQLEFSISACTRQPRNNEQHARDYYFYDEATFKNLIAENAFVEWEMVYPGKYYGTLHVELNRIWTGYKSPLVDIDVKGALAIHEKYPENSFSIFVEAPSLEALRERLQKRGTETAATLEERVQKAALELTFAEQFDAIIINDDLDTAAKELQQVVENFLAS